MGYTPYFVKFTSKYFSFGANANGIVFLISNSRSLSLVHRKKIYIFSFSFLYINPCILQTCSIHLLFRGILLLLILWRFLQRQSCHLWTNTILFLPSQSICLLFPFLNPFTRILSRSGERADPCLFLISEGKLILSLH